MVYKLLWKNESRLYRNTYCAMLLILLSGHIYSYSILVHDISIILALHYFDAIYVIVYFDLNDSKN